MPQAVDPYEGHHPDALDRTGYELAFDEDFADPALDPDHWVAHYLPHWTTPERSAARYELRPGVLRLRIDADQPAWRVDDGELRASNIQTGSFSGPLGSPIGQHRHRADLAVRTAQPTRRLYTPSTGLVEAVLRASPDPTCMLAFWLVGFEEESAEQSGEICVAELFGSAIGPRRSGVRIGVKAHNDPRLHDDMEEVALDLDASAWHSYAAEWTPERIRFFVDDRLVRIVRQRIHYPLQVMVDLFEFPEGTDRDPAAYPKLGEVRAVRGYRRLQPGDRAHLGTTSTRGSWTGSTPSSSSTRPMPSSRWTGPARGRRARSLRSTHGCVAPAAGLRGPVRSGCSAGCARVSLAQ